jgi:hypothetical protein
MAMRWIQTDRSGVRHSVALLDQRIAVPDSLSEAVRISGGALYVADPVQSALKKAAWLRALASQDVSYIVLHVDVASVTAGVAFGVPGGPPVLLVNHTAHLFWVGASVVDALINCRGSALEAAWASTHRGIARHVIVPIPLPEPGSMRIDKAAVKRRLGLDDHSIVILTVGASFKYLPVRDLDFLRTLEEVLIADPRTVLLAAGTAEDDRWRAASGRVGGRIIALGPVAPSDLPLLHGISDVYAEGFPFGTTTSLLEAGLRGIPVVLAPVQCPPPYGSDGIALDDTLQRPSSVHEYKEVLLRLVNNVAERRELGQRLKRAISQHHVGAGWQRHLDEVVATLPSEHAVYSLPAPHRTPADIHEYWPSLIGSLGISFEESLESAMQTALSSGLSPRFTPNMDYICRRFTSVRCGRTIPPFLLAIMCNHLFPRLSQSSRIRILQVCAFGFRRALLSRVIRRMFMPVRRRSGSVNIGIYEDYRKQPRHLVSLSGVGDASARGCSADMPAGHGSTIVTPCPQRVP